MCCTRSVTLNRRSSESKSSERARRKSKEQKGDGTFNARLILKALRFYEKAERKGKKSFCFFDSVLYDRESSPASATLRVKRRR